MSVTVAATTGIIVRGSPLNRDENVGVTEVQTNLGQPNVVFNHTQSFMAFEQLGTGTVRPWRTN